MSRWQEVSLPATPDTLDDLSIRLIAEGFDSFQVVDKRDLEEARPVWEIFDEELLSSDDCRILIYLQEGMEDDLVRLRALWPELTVRDRGEEEWADAWKQYYKPTPIGSRLLIQPAWIPLENATNRSVFINNPGMSFGTGLHASTQLCLELLESLELGNKRVLDIGCGSGILGICALLLGAESATGADIDPSAPRTAMENARLNGVETRYAAFSGDFLSDAEMRRAAGNGYDIVFSNIVADIIIALAPIIREHLTGSGYWIVSGIIEPRLSDVLAAAKDAGFAIHRERKKDGWCAVAFRS